LTANRPLAGVRVGLDLDGVCCDYVAYLGAFLLRSGRGPLPVPVTYRLREWFDTEEGRIAAHKAAVADGLHRDAPPVAGATTGVAALRALGASVVAVTGRGSYGEDRAEVVRNIAVWGRRHRITFDGVHCGRPKSAAGCDVYVDDAPDDVAALRDAGCLTVVFGQPWNEDLVPPRAAGWHDLPDVLVALLGPR
jgi:5'-nucleotidase